MVRGEVACRESDAAVAAAAAAGPQAASGAQRQLKMAALVERQKAREERKRPTLLTDHFASLATPTQAKQKKRLRRFSSLAPAQTQAQTKVHRPKARRAFVTSISLVSSQEDDDDEIESIDESDSEDKGRGTKRSRVETEDEYLDLFAEMLDEDGDDDDILEDVLRIEERVSAPRSQTTPVDPSLAPFLVSTSKASSRRPPPQSTPTEQASKKRKRSAPTPREDGLPSSINDWPGAEAVARISGISSVTCVDPGTRNLAIMRMEFAPTIRVTHVHVLDLDLLRQHYQTLEPEVQLVSATARGSAPLQSRLYALAKYVAEQASSGGCFDSTMCLVEEQSFDRVMSRVEATIVTVFNSVKPLVRLLDQDGGAIPAGRSVTARTVKTCYRPLFPLLPSESSSAGAAPTSAGSSSGARSSNNSRRRAFGVGDAHHNRESEKQRREHKKNAIKYGSMIVPQSAFERLVPASNLTAEDVDRLKKRKMDDLYDTLFMCSYFLSTWMFEFYKIRRRGVSRPLPAHETPSQRSRNRFEELIEICGALGSDRDDVQHLVDVLTDEALQLKDK